jgi:dipeptidyl aminopeptidase/acylaminoacyl peptidase
MVDKKFWQRPAHVVYSLALISLMLCSPSADAQPADGLTPFDVARIRSVGALDLAPDGIHVAYSVSIPSDPLVEDAPARSEIRVRNLETGVDQLLIASDVGARGITWTPDGSRLSFLAKMEGDEYTSLYSVGTGGESPIRVVAADRSVGTYDWSEDGRLVAFIANEDKPASPTTLPVKPNVYEEAVSNDKVWIARADDVEVAVRMLRHEGSASAVHWSPDGTRLVVSIAPTPLTDDSYMSKRIHVLDAASGEVVARIENPGKLDSFDWSPDGRYIAMISGIDINDPSQGRLMLASAKGGAVTDIIPTLPGHVGAFAWTSNNSLRYIAGVGVGTEYGEVGADGSNRRVRLESDTYSLNDFDVSPDGRTSVFTVDAPTHPTELFSYTTSDDQPLRLTESNPWLANVPLADQEVVRYSARDGLELEGLLIRPLGEQPGQQYPLITVVHGGPESHYSNGWLTGYSSPGQVAAAKGIAVFYPNYRGSTGRGVEFSKTSQADPAGKEFDDVVDAVDHLIQVGLVDKDRVGVTGGSYGGYATAWMSTYYSDRFAAGVMFVGISNKISKVGTTDIPNEEYLVHARKRPWDDWQFFLERSPVYYAERGRTPLLIMHGEEDPRVDPGQSRELYRHLKLRGSAPVRLVLYPGEGHGNRNSAARLDYSLRSMRWLEHYLVGPGGDPPPYPIEVSASVEVIEPAN